MHFINLVIICENKVMVFMDI